MKKKKQRIYMKMVQTCELKIRRQVRLKYRRKCYAMLVAVCRSKNPSMWRHVSRLQHLSSHKSHKKFDFVRRFLIFPKILIFRHVASPCLAFDGLPGEENLIIIWIKHNFPHELHKCLWCCVCVWSGTNSTLTTLRDAHSVVPDASTVQIEYKFGIRYATQQ